eukprot:gb/GECG01016767.1/.p1 GENE.gb/GECG01016767.1/~~gb/GECG01016767.1/.p1  ORF type:complete len:215 (+),score=24.53 gb/GECG01016767.1/:1-645(+)
MASAETGTRPPSKNLNQACIPCAQSKRKCDGHRPCQRCRRLGRESDCVDRPPKKRSRDPSDLITYACKAVHVLPENHREGDVSLVDLVAEPKLLTLPAESAASTGEAVASHSIFHCSEHFPRPALQSESGNQTDQTGSLARVTYPMHNIPSTLTPEDSKSKEPQDNNFEVGMQSLTNTGGNVDIHSPVGLSELLEQEESPQVTDTPVEEPECFS